MRESAVEKYLREQVEKYGGTCEKFKSPQRKHVPDRICFWPDGRSQTMQFLFGDAADYSHLRGEMDLVECKKPGETPNDGQARDHRRRRKAGFRVFVISDKRGVDVYVEMARQRMMGQAQRHGKL